MNDKEQDLDELRKAFRERDGERDEDASQPSADEIRAAALGEASPKEVQRVAEHMASSPAGAAAWRLADELQEELGSEQAARLTGGSSRWRWPLGLAAAAALVLAFVLVRPPQETTQEPPVFRDTPGIAAQIEASEGSATIRRESPLLAWTDESAPAGTLYDLVVLDENLVPIEEAFDLELPRYTLSEGVAGRLEAGGLVYWRVIATDPDGTRRESRTFQAPVE